MHKKSRVHHYIPQFYLKNFTINNKFYIYLKKEDRYKKNGMLFTPETHFFELHGNAIFIDDETSDFLEIEAYKNLDNAVANIFNKLNRGGELEARDIGHLIYFVGHLFWRNPANDDLARLMLKTYGLKALGLVLKNQNGEKLTNHDLEERIVNNPSMYKQVKYIMPVATFQRTFECDSMIRVLDFIPGGIPSIIGDTPLIFRHPSKMDIYKDDFILPISRQKILIRSKKIKSLYQNQDKIYMDLLLIQQANNFVSTTDKAYIPELQKLMKRFTIESLRQHLFECFTE